MNHETDAELVAAIHEAVSVALKAAGAPLPAMSSPEFIAAPIEVRIAVLAIGGSSYVFAREAADSWLSDDYIGGRFHRHHQLPLVTDLMRRRYPPTGCRETWIKFGPDGPPTEAAA